MIESAEGISNREFILEILADSVKRYFKSTDSGNLKFVDIHESLTMDLYWIARNSGISSFDTAKVFLEASPARSRKKVLAVLAQNNLLSQRDARRIERSFMIPASRASSPVHKT